MRVVPAVLRIFTSLALAGAALGLGPARATADEQSLMTCMMNGTTTFSPGLLLTPQPVTVNAHRRYDTCLSTAPGVTSGESIRALNITTGCLSQGAPFTAVETITWNNGQTSDFSHTETNLVAGGQSTVVRTGTITAGLFAGASAQSVAVSPTPNIADCLASPGLTTKATSGTLTITAF